MARAVRAVVIAAENFRLRAARTVLGVGSTEMSALFFLFTEGTSTPTERNGGQAADHHGVGHRARRATRQGRARAARAAPPRSAQGRRVTHRRGAEAGGRDGGTRRDQHGPVHEPALRRTSARACCGSCTISRSPTRPPARPSRQAGRYSTREWNECSSTRYHSQGAPHPHRRVELARRRRAASTASRVNRCSNCSPVRSRSRYPP